MAMVVSTIAVPRTGNAGYDTTNLVSWWSCDETSGVRVDAHGDNDLTDNNTVLYDTGKVGNACDFESTNSEYLSKADATDGLDMVDSDMTIGAWVKRESDASSQMIFGKLDGALLGSGRSWGLGFDFNDHTDITMLTSDGANYEWDSDDHTFAPASWYFVVVKYDVTSGNIQFLVNDVYQSTQSGKSSAGYDVASYFALGAYKDGATVGGFFDGLIDEAFIFKEEVATSTLTALYNSGNGMSYASFIASTSSTSTASTTATSTTSVDVEELKWVLELYLSIFMFLIFTYLGYRFTKIFL